ncbi:unnamed protein product [Trifolium pratense]|uniref:Uncharacterized protein n=1 Tax=Trifolium pratense TaxID=57577 RepID=A0ACB0KBW5_TRIPR|nr:unnamed protein product [Trifolium pratense]
MEKSNLLCKVAKQGEEVTKLNADLDQVTKVAKMMTKGTDAFEEMLQRQNYGKPKPIGFEHERVKQQMKFNNATIHTPINNTFVSGGLSQHLMEQPPSNLRPVTAAVKKETKKTAEKKKEIIKVSDAISPSGNKSSKGSSKRSRRDYKSKFSLSMSDLVFESNVNTSEKATEVKSKNPKTVTEVVEIIVPTGDNLSQEKLGSDAEKRDLNAMPVETEMEDTPTEVEPNIADKSPTIAEMVAEKSNHEVTEEVVMQDVETSLNENEDAETVEEEPVKAAAEKDVETTDTTSEASKEETGTANEGTSDDEGDTQSEESNQSIPTDEQEVEADKQAETEKEKERDVVDVDDYETTKTVERPSGGITKRLRSCTGKAVATASKTPAPRVKTKGVGPVKGNLAHL